jgi:hypothetical protein
MRDIQPQFFLLPLLFPLMHISYGLGTIVSILDIPFWKHKLKKQKELEAQKDNSTEEQ